MLNQVIELIADELNIDKAGITADTKLREDLNVDSLDVVDLIMKLEDTFNIEVSDEAAAKLISVADIVAYVQDATK